MAANELPKYMQVCYFALLGVVKEMEDKLVNKEPLCCMHYAKEAVSKPHNHECTHWHFFQLIYVHK